MAKISAVFAPGLSVAQRERLATETVDRVFMRVPARRDASLRDQWRAAADQAAALASLVAAERERVEHTQQAFAANPIHGRVTAAIERYAMAAHVLRVIPSRAHQLEALRLRREMLALDQQRHHLGRIYLERAAARLDEVVAAQRACRFLRARLCLQLIENAERRGTPPRRTEVMRRNLAKLEPDAVVFLPASPKYSV